MALEMGMDRIAAHLKMDRMELRRRNFIGPHEFPYTIPSGSTYDSGDYGAVVDKALARIDFPALMRQRDELRGQGRLAGIGISTCLAPNGRNSDFQPLFQPTNETNTWMAPSLLPDSQPT